MCHGVSTVPHLGATASSYPWREDRSPQTWCPTSLIEGEDALWGAFYPRCHLCLSGPLVSHCQSPQVELARIKKVGLLRRASARTEDGSSPGPTLSVCSSATLTYTSKRMPLLSLSLKCQCYTWSQAWDASLSLAVCH